MVSPYPNGWLSSSLFVAEDDGFAATFGVGLLGSGDAAVVAPFAVGAEPGKTTAGCCCFRAAEKEEDGSSIVLSCGTRNDDDAVRTGDIDEVRVGINLGGGGRVGDSPPGDCASLGLKVGGAGIQLYVQ